MIDCQSSFKNFSKIIVRLIALCIFYVALLSYIGGGLLLILIFGSFYLVTLLISLWVIFRYVSINKRTNASFDVGLIVYVQNGNKREINKANLTKIKLFKSATMDDGWAIFPHHFFNKAIIYLNDGTEIILTSYLHSDIEKPLRKTGFYYERIKRDPLLF